MQTKNRNRSQEASPTKELVGVDVPRLVLPPWKPGIIGGTIMVAALLWAGKLLSQYPQCLPDIWWYVGVQMLIPGMIIGFSLGIVAVGWFLRQNVKLWHPPTQDSDTPMNAQITTPPQQPAEGGLFRSDLLALSERLKARAENAYIGMIGAARKDEALGWEIKVERGTFGRPELDAHSAIAEKLGRHRGLMEAHNLLEEILRANAGDHPPGANEKP